MLLIGGYLFLQGELTLGALSAFVQYSTNIVWPMEMLGWLSNDFSSAVGSYRKIRKVYDQKPSIQEPKEPIVLPEVTGDIRFEHIKRTSMRFFTTSISMWRQAKRSVSWARPEAARRP